MANEVGDERRRNLVVVKMGITRQDGVHDVSQLRTQLGALVCAKLYVSKRVQTLAAAQGSVERTGGRGSERAWTAGERDLIGSLR